MVESGLQRIPTKVAPPVSETSSAFPRLSIIAPTTEADAYKREEVAVFDLQ